MGRHRETEQRNSAGSTSLGVELDRELESMFKKFARDLKSPGGRRAYRVKLLPGRAEIIGVYPVRAEVSCHLVELQFEDVRKRFCLSDCTQAMDGRGRSFWQSPWMECLLNSDGTEILARDDAIAAGTYCGVHFDSRSSSTIWTS
jgi:hypothetical protein